MQCYRLFKFKIMKKQDYEKLKNAKAYEALWIELLNASGFAGIMPNGEIVDRRYYDEAKPINENSLLGISKPKSV